MVITLNEQINLFIPSHFYEFYYFSSDRYGLYDIIKIVFENMCLAILIMQVLLCE